MATFPFFLPNVRNYHVTATATEDSILFGYEAVQGVCEKSFGIHVARWLSSHN